MKSSNAIEDNEPQQQDSFFDKEQRLKQKLKQKQEERQQRRQVGSTNTGTSEVPTEVDNGTSSQASDSNKTTGSSAIITSKEATNESQRSGAENSLSPGHSNGMRKLPNPPMNLKEDRHRQAEMQQSRLRNPSRGRCGRTPHLRERFPASHPGGQNWNMIRDDYGRAVPFIDDPHHPGHFCDAYYDLPPYYPFPHRGADFYDREPFHGVSPRGATAEQNYHSHYPLASNRGAGAGLYRDGSYNARPRANDFNGSRHSWDQQQHMALLSEAGIGAETSKLNRSSHSRSRSIAHSSSASHTSSWSSVSEGNRSSGRRRRRRASSLSVRSNSTQSSRSRHRSVSSERSLVRSSGESNVSLSIANKRGSQGKSRREKKSRKKIRSRRSHKRRHGPIDQEEEEEVRSITSKHSYEETKDDSNSAIESKSLTKEEGQQNLSSEEKNEQRSLDASPEEKGHLNTVTRASQEVDLIDQIERDGEERKASQKSVPNTRRQDMEKKKRKRKRSGRSSHSSCSRSQNSSTVSSDTDSRSSRRSATHSRLLDREDSATSHEKSDQSSATKDQRTIFISQLVMRTTEHDVRKFLRKYVAVSKVKQVIFLQDKRTGRHKGCCYVELGRLSDVQKAVEYDGKIPSFQRFPILIKPSEAEKNYLSTAGTEPATVFDSALTTPVIPAATSATGLSSSASTIDATGKRVIIQNVYIGSIDRLVTQAQLHAIFSQFGQLTSLHLPLDPSTGLHRGYAFLSYSDAKSANLAIKTMAGQSIAGRQLKTGWASNPSSGNVEVVTSDELPEDYAQRVQKVNAVLIQVNGTGLLTIPLAAATAVMMPDSSASMMGSALPVAVPAVSVVPINVQSVAEAALNAALGTSAAPNFGQSPSDVAAIQAQQPTVEELVAPTSHILIHNMFDKDKETEDRWWDDIREEVTQECTTFGKCENVVVMHELPGGKVYVSFQNEDMAKRAACALEGRWFDQRQLHVQFVKKDEIP